MINDNNGPGFEEALRKVVEQDFEGLINAQNEYGDSWKQDGGVGAYFTLLRPLHRLVRLARSPASNGQSFDIFQHCLDSVGDAGVLNATRDLRRYLCLVEAHLVQAGHSLPVQRHNEHRSKNG